MKNITYIITIDEADDAEEDKSRKSLLGELSKLKNARVQIQMAWEAPPPVPPPPPPPPPPGPGGV